MPVWTALCCLSLARSQLSALNCESYLSRIPCDFTLGSQRIRNQIYYFTRLEIQAILKDFIQRHWERELIDWLLRAVNKGLAAPAQTTPVMRQLPALLNSSRYIIYIKVLWHSTFNSYMVFQGWRYPRRTEAGTFDKIIKASDEEPETSILSWNSEALPSLRWILMAWRC